MFEIEEKLTSWDIVVLIREHAQRLTKEELTVEIKKLAKRIYELSEHLPYKSLAQERYFNAHRGKLEAFWQRCRPKQDIPHNGSSGVGGNAASAEVADLAARLREVLPPRCRWLVSTNN